MTTPNERNNKINANETNDKIVFALGGDDEIYAGRGPGFYDGGDDSSDPGDPQVPTRNFGSSGDLLTYEFLTESVEVSLPEETVTRSNGQVDQIRNFEIIRGTSQNDRFVGDAERNYFIGGRGSDTLSGGAGGDILQGDSADRRDGGGVDFLFGGDGDDFMIGGPGNDLLDGGGPGISFGNVLRSTLGEKLQPGETATISLGPDNSNTKNVIDTYSETFA